MHEYCKRTCTNQCTEVCALPSVPDRAAKRSKIIWAVLVESLARTGAATHGVSLGFDTTGLISTSLGQMDIIHVPAEACVWLSMLEDAG